MEWYDLEVDGRQTVKFADLQLPLLSPTAAASSSSNSPKSPSDDDQFVDKKLGGIIRHGEWAWLAKNSMLQIVSVRSGQTISTYEFCESRGYDSCCIKCVEELFPNNPEIMVLAVILENFHGPSGGGSFVVLYSIELSCVLCTYELSLHITCARFLNSSTCKRTLLQNFDGCLSVGSEEGVVVLLDLNMGKMCQIQSEAAESTFTPCHIVDYSIPLKDIHRNFRQCKQDGITFGLQMEVIESPCSIQCIQSIDLIMGLAIGLEDGRLALYDLAEMQIFYIARPKPEIAMSPLVKIDYLEPPDDPRPCLYIWTLHENGENLYAMLHSLMYEKRIAVEEEENGRGDVTENGQYYFESFLTSTVRLELPLEATKSEALACQAISTHSSHSEEDANCLCAISWYSVLEGKNKLLIFDLNQWYKEEMPAALMYGQQPSYLAGYILNGECNGLNTYLQPGSITHFNSMQRFEEHFYPNSLSFDCSLLHTEGCRRYNWEGAQNRLINLLRVSNASIFLEPNNCFNEILRTRLMPQFMELNLNSTFSKQAKYEVMLSAALENNCISLLRDCAKSWIDGSFMGDFAVATGLSLSTLTDWIWQRANAIKLRSNDLCKGLFEFGGYPLDQREQKELCFITRQLKLLMDLLGEILKIGRKQIPERVYSSLENNYNSLRMASNYQDLLLWLLNIGLLPEASPFNSQVNSQYELVPYPYRELKEFYSKKRLYFRKLNEQYISKKSGSCRLLYIDAFIEHTCKSKILHEYWLENDGDGLYPPNSLEAMLRVMLVPELDYEQKYAILLYFFLDLNMAIDEEAYKNVVANFIKFPSVFKLSAALIKTVQSFWNLDHDQFLPAVEEFISPFNKNQSYPQWLVELLIESLLTQNAANLALRILESQPSLIAPMLKLKTLLCNDLISEAFHFVRSKNDNALMEYFFTRCLSQGQFGVIRDLALSEQEGLILQNILKRSKAPGAESLHFVYLLQKSKYIEAVSYMDELSSKPKTLRGNLPPAQMETPNMVLSAFNTTMTPVTQGLTDVYFRIKNKIKKKDVDNKSPVPLSCQLIKQNANSLLGGIYHSSALSAHFATYYWGEMDEERHQNGAKHLLSSNNAPFLRKPQNDTNFVDFLNKPAISYPQVYKVREKRNLIESEILASDEQEQMERQKMENQLNPKKKRRLVGQDIVNDLKQFMEMNKQKAIKLNANDFRFHEKTSTSEKEEEEEELSRQEPQNLDILTKPLLGHKSGSLAPRESEEAQPHHELQSILKSSNSEFGLTSSSASQPDEEKNLRFRLPSRDLNNSIISQHGGMVGEEKEDDDQEEMECEDQQEELELVVKANKPSFKNSDLRKKQIVRSLSVESNKSSVSSSNPSEDNFYSPLSSQNTSKLDSSTLSRCSFVTGPKPRRPISRLSGEIEGEQRKSMEKETQGNRKSMEKEVPRNRDSLEKELQENGTKSVEKELGGYKMSQEERKFPQEERKSKEKEISRNWTTTKPSEIHESMTGNEEVEKEVQMQADESCVANKDETLSEHYVTAAGPSIFNISSRKSLASVAANQKVEESQAYTTAMANVEGGSNFRFSQTSSGFGSLSARSTLASAGSSFIPKVSSSKVGNFSTPFKTETKLEIKATKLSECSTVVGSFDYTSSVAGGSNNIFAMPSIPPPVEKAKDRAPTEEQKQQMLDTTLGMSTYDFSVLDTTASGKSSLMFTARDEVSSKEETREDKEGDLSSKDQKEIEQKEEEKQEVSEEKEKQGGEEMKVKEKSLEKEDVGGKKDSPSKQNDIEQMEGISKEKEIKESSKEKEKEEEEEQMDVTDEESEANKEVQYILKPADISDEHEDDSEAKRDWGDLLCSSDEDDCIVLSSSSSYIDDNDYGRPFEVRETDGEESPNKSAERADIDSERSFDTGEYDDYAEDANGDSEDDAYEDEIESQDDKREYDEDIVEVLDDSSTDTERKSANFPEESNSEDVKFVDEVQGSNEVSKLGLKGTEEGDKETKEEVVSTSSGVIVEPEAPSSSSKAVEEKFHEETLEVSSSTKETREEEATAEEDKEKETDMEKPTETEEETRREEISKPEEEASLEKEVAKENESKTESSVNELEKPSSKEGETETTQNDESGASKSPKKPEEIQEMDTHESSPHHEEETSKTVDSLSKEETSAPTMVEEEQITLRIDDEDSMNAAEAAEVRLRKKLQEEEEEVNDSLTELPIRNKRTRRTSVSTNLDNSTVASPRRTTRGSSVPPIELQAGMTASPRRTARGTSVPPGEESKTTTTSRRSIRATTITSDATEEEEEVISRGEEVQKPTTSRRNVRATSVTPAESEGATKEEPKNTKSRRSIRATSVTPAEVTTQPQHEIKSSRRSIRGTSVPPAEITAEAVASPRPRGTRGTSVPPPSVVDLETTAAPSTPSRRRSLRATSLQPKSKLEETEEETDQELGATPSKRGKLQSSETETTSRSVRGSSVPATGKVSTRRRSILLDAINEVEPTSTVVDSPASHTRFRSRLNSNESEHNSSVAMETEAPSATATKRSRRTSLSGNSSGDLPVTPKINRRNSVSSQSEAAVVTPRTLRGRSILSVPEEDNESVPPSPKPSESNRRIGAKRKPSTDEKPAEKEESEAAEEKKTNSPKSGGESSALYSSSRRLTRTQLAMMEKTANLTPGNSATNMESPPKESSPKNKRSTAAASKVARPSSAATNVSHDSEDEESVSSKRSVSSNVTATTKRRTTRRSVKEKEEHEDDAASIASSVGSEKNTRSRRSKDKGSPSSVLSSIPEDAPVETKKRGRHSTKH
ncbi:protein ELYS homolog [Musca domestica]|uniref:Protein ELYS homolog n=1 Tax=Musca domestica TaxID=7370 RepID=A0ABM3UMA2_MUSDO|nr:protein ELYS homolog [Musca domestica]